MFTHAFTANRRYHAISSPIKPLFIGGINQMFEKRWVASNQVAVGRPKESERGENFVHVRASGFDNAIGAKGRAHSDAGRPGSHREGIDDEKWTFAKVIAMEVAAHPARMLDLSL